MDKAILEAWDKHNHKLKDVFREHRQSEYGTYEKLLRHTLSTIFPGDEDGVNNLCLDCNGITRIDNGDYQGTIVFVVAENICQPGVDNHWYTSVGYGSCSGCDTLQNIQSLNIDDAPNEAQVENYWTLCLHMMQKLKRMEANDE